MNRKLRAAVRDALYAQMEADPCPIVDDCEVRVAVCAADWQPVLYVRTDEGRVDVIMSADEWSALAAEASRASRLMRGKVRP